MQHGAKPADGDKAGSLSEDAHGAANEGRGAALLARPQDTAHSESGNVFAPDYGRDAAAVTRLERLPEVSGISLNQPVIWSD